MPTNFKAITITNTLFLGHLIGNALQLNTCCPSFYAANVGDRIRIRMKLPLLIQVLLAIEYKFVLHRLTIAYKLLSTLTIQYLIQYVRPNKRIEFNTNHIQIPSFQLQTLRKCWCSP